MRSWNVIALLCALVPGSESPDWTNWRGPQFNGMIEVGPLTNRALRCPMRTAAAPDCCLEPSGD